MAKFISLMKVQLNSQYGFSLAKYALKNDKKALAKGIGLGLVILLALGQFAFIYTFLMVKLYESAKTLNAPQLIITMGAAASGLFILFLGIFYILSALFLAKDTEFLSSLPIKQGSVFISKFLLVLIGEYPFALFLMLPPVIIFGIGAGKGVLYYLTGLLCILLIPLVPLVISSLFSLGLMRIVSRSRRRDLITIIGSIVLLVLFLLGQNFLFSRIPENDPNFLVNMLQKSDGLIELTGRVFPPAVWITRALSLTGMDAVTNLLYLVLLSGVAFGMVYLLASFIYQKGATAQLETERKAGKTRLTYEVSSPVKVMFVTEWRNLLRTPVYALNSLIMIFVGPLIMCMPLLGGNFAQDPDIQALYSLIQNSDFGPSLTLILAGIMLFFSMINPAVSSTFSREGKNFWILKSIPVNPFKQVLGKLITGYSISFLGALATAIVMKWAFKVTFMMTVTSLLTCLLALIPICASGILIDLKRPKLNWGNPQEAIKQNVNVMLAMLVGFILTALFGAVGFLLISIMGNSKTVLLLIMAFLLLLSGVSIWILKRASRNAYQKIEA